MPGEPYTGGCLCGAVRYEAKGEPSLVGHCYCADCRKASGSGFIPFMGFPAGALSVTGEVRQFRSPAFRGGEAVRNYCPTCGGLVFGGVLGESESHTVYAGSLDDPSRFRPAIALFNRDRPDWAVLPPGLTVFETMLG
ncbi:MAG TPA: GFA family protein [Phenylobacterium sp.]